VRAETMQRDDQRGDGSCSVVLIDSLERWADIAKCWADLLAQSRSNTLFLTWEWLFTWAECFLESDCQLFILAVYKQSELTGVAPWCIRHSRKWGIPVRSIEFLGTPEAGSDYLDVFARPRKEREVAQAIHSFLFKEVSSRWDRLILHDIPSDSLFLMHFLNQIEAEGKTVELQPGSFCPIMNLPNTREQFLSQLSPHRRRQYLRDIRGLEKEGGFNYRRFQSNDITDSLKTLCALYVQRWKTSGDLARFLERLVSRYHGTGWFEIGLLEIKGTCVAATFQLRYANTLSQYIQATDRLFKTSVHVSIGNALVGLSLENAIEDGFSTYDFLKGTEEYKFLWADGGRRCLNVRFYRPRVAVVVELIGQFLKAMAKLFVR